VRKSSETLSLRSRLSAIGRDALAAGTSSVAGARFWSTGGGNLAMTGVAPVIALGEPSRKVSQMALPDSLTTQRTASLLVGRHTIHDDKFHVLLPTRSSTQRQLGRGCSVVERKGDFSHWDCPDCARRFVEG
jgi:hypothetical protein